MLACTMKKSWPTKAANMDDDVEKEILEVMGIDVERTFMPKT